MEKVNQKILFIDQTSLPGSVVKILARNINVMNDDELTIHVIQKNDFKHFHFSTEKIVLVDPLISINEILLVGVVPKEVKVRSFSTNDYCCLNYEGIIEQINSLLAE